MDEGTKRLLGLILRTAADDPMLFSLAAAHWAARQPKQVVFSLAEALLEERLSELLESRVLAEREGDFRKRRLLVWIEGIAEARPGFFARAGLQYVRDLPLGHLLPFARFLAAAQALEASIRELEEGQGNGQPQ